MLRVTIAIAGAIIMTTATILLVLAIALTLPANPATIALLVALLSAGGLAIIAFIRFCLFKYEPRRTLSVRVSAPETVRALTDARIALQHARIKKWGIDR